MVTFGIMDHTYHSRIIDDLGGSSAVAKLFGIRSQAVSKWRRTGIPDGRLMYLKLLRPDVDWACLRSSSVEGAE